eukprot:g18654.t1
MESHDGVSSVAVGSLCAPAKLALEHMTANTMKKARRVQSGGIASGDYGPAKELLRKGGASQKIDVFEELHVQGREGIGLHGKQEPKTVKDAESYRSRLADFLLYVRRFAFPSTPPSGLARLSDEPPRRFVVSPTRCTDGGELLAEKDVDGTLLTEAT